MSHPTPWVRGLSWIWPIACLSCGETTNEPRLGLCPGCARRLRAAAAVLCRGCGRDLPAAGDGACCPRCRDLVTPLERLVVGWLYEPPCDRVLAALKFRRLDYLGAELGRGLASRFADLRHRHAVVVPVPLHWRRRLARGYNQAERIAAPFAAELELPRSEALCRRRATRRQMSLDRQRRLDAPAGAFVARRSRRPDIAGARVLLVDDVFTTGATLRAAAQALLEAGASAVTGVVAARVRARDERV